MATKNIFIVFLFQDTCKSFRVKYPLYFLPTVKAPTLPIWELAPVHVSLSGRRGIKMYYRKRGDKWYFEFSFVDKRTGERRRVNRVGGKTKKEAIATARKALGKNLNILGEWDEPERMPMSDLWKLYLAEYAEIHLKPNTIKNYTGLWTNHIEPDIGRLTLVDIKPRTLQAILNDRRDKLAQKSLQSLAFLIRSIFRYAVNICQFMPVNPALGIIVPASTKKRKSGQGTTHVFTAQQMQVIFDYFTPDHRYYIPIMLAYHTGMRLGECLALQWSDVDFTKKEIFVHTTLYDDHGVGIIQNTPKTNSSVRRIVMSAKLYQALRTHKKTQLEMRLLQAGRYYKNNFVCTRENGKPMTSNDMRFFGDFCHQRFGDGSFHSLRHTHATLLLEAGEDLELVSKRLGHSGINTTAKIYSHVLEKRREKSLLLMNEVL